MSRGLHERYRIWIDRPRARCLVIVGGGKEVNLNRKVNAYGSASSWITVDLGGRKYLLLSTDIFTHTAYLRLVTIQGTIFWRNQFPYISRTASSSSLLSRPTFPSSSSNSLSPSDHAFQTARQFCICRDNCLPLLPLRHLTPTQQPPYAHPPTRGPRFSKLTELTEHPLTS